jgi:predicted kinase
MEKKTQFEIEREFKSQLAIPQLKPSSQLFFCPVGLVGAGKTTITKPISEKFNLLRISSDELRKLLKENGYSYEPLKDILLNISSDYAKQGYSIAFDMDCGNPILINAVEEWAAHSGAKVIWVHINTPQEFIFEKFKKHPPTWLADNPQIMIDNYLAQKERRQKEGRVFDFFYEFDTSRDDIKVQIEECIEKMVANLKLK